MAQYNLLVTLFFICAVASASLDGTSTVATAGEEKELGGRIRSPAMMVTDRGTFYGGSGTQDNNDREGTLTRHLRNVGDKVLQDVSSSKGATTPTEETLNVLRESSANINVPSSNSDKKYTDSDSNVEQDNNELLVERVDTKLNVHLGDVHRDNNDNSDLQERSSHADVLQERDAQIDNRTMTSESFNEEQVSK